MSAKLLNAFTDDNPDLDKHIGCMTGIFQMFDRHHLLAGRRLNGHSRKKLPSGDAPSHDSHTQAETNPLPPQIILEKNLSRSLNENQRVSVESSRASFSSSSCSSSFSSLECNKSTQQEPSLFEQTTFPKRSLKNSPTLQSSEIDSRLIPSSPRQYSQNLSSGSCRQSLDFRDVVKDSISRETHSLSIRTSNKDQVKKHVVKHRDSPRPLPLSETIEGSYLIGKNEKPKMSVDLNKSIQVLAKLKEAPTYFSENKTPRSSYEAKDGSFFPVAQEAPRFSYDGMSHSSVDSREQNKCSTRLKELPRLSLDSRQSSVRSSNVDPRSNFVTKDLEGIEAHGKKCSFLTLQQDLDANRQATGVVAKLMGLEAMPWSPGTQDNVYLSKRCTTDECNAFLGFETASSSSKALQMPGENKQEQYPCSPKSSLKYSAVPRLRPAEQVKKPISASRIPIETAPWKQQGKSYGTQPMTFRSREDHVKQQHESVYSEIKRKLTQLEFQQSNKDLRALKQIFDAIQAKGLLETKRSEAPSSELPDNKNKSNQAVSRMDQNLITSNRQRPHSCQSQSTPVKGANTSRPLEAEIVIMKPAKSINKSTVPPSSIIPFDELSSVHKIHTGDATDMKETSVNNHLAKEQDRRLSLGEPATQILLATGKHFIRHREENSVQMSQSSPRPQQLRKENGRSMVKTSGSVSPRPHQKKIEPEKKSHQPVPSSESTKTRKQSTTRHISESLSPRCKLRPKVEKVHQSNDILREISIDKRNLSHQAKSNVSRASQLYMEVMSTDGSTELTSSLIQQHSQSPSETAIDNVTSIVKEKKSLQDFSEDASPELSTTSVEQPSPVSVLDASFYRDDLLPSPVNRISNSLRGDDMQKSAAPSGVIWKMAGPNSHLPNDPKCDVNSAMYDNKLESIENLLQKLRQLSLSNDDKSPATGHMAALCEMQNPDRRYISEVLLASGLFNTAPDSPMPIRLHKSGCAMDPGLFVVLEQTKLGGAEPQPLYEMAVPSKCDAEKLHRRLLFDTVNEILTHKVEVASLAPRPGGKLADRIPTGEQLLKELSVEIERLQVHGHGSLGLDDEDDGLKPILCEDVAHQSERWKDHGKEISGLLVLDIERSIFRDLINEVVNGESAASGLLAKTSRRRRQLF